MSMPYDSSVSIESRLEITPSARRRRRVVRWSIWLVVVAAVLAGAAAAARSMRAPAPVGYQTEPVQRGPLTVSVTATGDVQSLTEVKVGTEISGIVETVSVDFNSRVARGQVLAKVNTDKLEAQAQQAKAALDSARADVANAEAAVEDTRRSFDRSQALFDRTLVSRSDRDAAESASKKAEASRLAAVARVGQAEANLSALDTDLKKAYIRSPIDGIVLDRQIDPGQTVAASFQTPVLFTLSEDLTRMKLSVNVDEADIGKVRVGQSATFRVDAYPNKSFASRVTEIRSTPKTSNGVVTYETILAVDNKARLLQPGMTATADIVVTTVPDTLLVSNAALRFTPPAASQPASGRGRGGFFLLPPPPPGARRTPPPAKGQPRIWILEDNNPTPIDVVTGPSDGKVTAITVDEGLVQPGAPAIVDLATNPSA
jgi:HlyD family secretion protein